MAAPTFVADEIVTAAKLNSLPKGILGYAQVTAAQTGIGASITDLTGLSVTVDVQASRRIKIVSQLRGVQRTAASTPEVAVREGATELTRVGHTLQINEQDTMTAIVVITPTVGAHTYKLSALTAAGTFDVSAAAGRPASLLVEDIGAV